MSIEINTEAYSLSLPNEWVHRPHPDPATHYFEREDGLWGAYVKGLDFRTSTKFESAIEIVSHVQLVHMEAFAERPDSNWRVIGQALSSQVDEATSTLDLYDEAKSYRVVSRVSIRGAVGVQVTLHNYCAAPGGS